MSVSKAWEQRGKDEAALLEQLQQYKKEFLELRASQATNGLGQKAGRIRVCRQNIARTLTVITEKRIAAAKDLWAGKKRVPRELRPKLTRRLRQQMTPYQRNLKPLKVQKREQNFPMRRIAIKRAA